MLKIKIVKNKQDFIFTLPQLISKLYELKDGQEFEMDYSEKDEKLIIKMMTKINHGYSNNELCLS